MKENILQNRHGESIRLSQPMSSTLADRYGHNSYKQLLRKSQTLLRQAKDNLSARKSMK